MPRILITDAKVPPPVTLRPHTVPRFYLDKFAIRERRTWVYRRDVEPRLRSTKSLTTEGHFYEYEFGNENTNNRIEQWLQKLETKASLIYSKVQSGTSLNPTQQVDWALFVASLFLRTRKWRRQMVEPYASKFVAEQNSTDSVRQMQHELFKQGRLVEAHSIRAAQTRLLVQLQGQPAIFHLQYLTDSVKKLATVLLSRDWYLQKPAAGKFFISSDAPVCSFKLGEGGKVFDGYGFNQPDSVAYLPLTPTRAWIASARHFSWHQDLDRQSTETMNRLSISFAEEIVFAHVNDDDLKVEVAAYLNQTVFGKTAFVDASRLA